METTTIEEWRKLFNRGYKLRIVENEHLQAPIFHQTLSAINNRRFVFGSKYKVANLSTFKVQQSGTGKGVADDFTCTILKHLNVKHTYLNTFTEAGAVGSITGWRNPTLGERDSNGRLYLSGEKAPIVTYGALHDNRFLWVDEARSIITGNKWTAGMLETINGYLETGYVHKRLAAGSVEYPSRCVIGTGTFFFEGLKPIFSTGLFQRFNMTFKKFETDDVIRISKKFDELASSDWLRELKPVLDELKELHKSIQSRFDFSNDAITMTNDESRHFGSLVDDYFEKNIKDCFKDKMLNNLMNSFLLRAKSLGHKHAALYSIWNDDKVIGAGAGDYAFPFVKSHLDAAKELIEVVFETTDYDEEKLTSFKLKEGRTNAAKCALKSYIATHLGVTKTEIRAAITAKELHSPLGINSSMKLLEQMLQDEEGIVQKQGAASAEKKLFVTEVNQI